MPPRHEIVGAEIEHDKAAPLAAVFILVARQKSKVDPGIEGPWLSTGYTVANFNDNSASSLRSSCVHVYRMISSSFCPIPQSLPSST